MEITGLAQTIDRLKQLDNKVQKSILRKSLRAGAKQILGPARANAPVLTGTLRRNIKVRAGRSRKGTVSIIVGVGKKWFTGKAFYAAFVALGHRVGRRSLGTLRKQVPANDFMAKAYEQGKGAAVQTIKDTCLDLIEQATKGE